MADRNGTNDSDRLLTERDLGLLQLSTLLYYLHETNPDNGLVRDKTDPTAPVSIAACGMALATIPVVVERGVMFRDFAAKITRKRLRYLVECPARSRAGCLRLQRLLLSFPGHRNRSSRLAVRAFHHRLGVSIRGRTDSCAPTLTVTRRRDRNQNLGKCALWSCRLELGTKWWANSNSWLAARERVHPTPVPGLRRRSAALHTWTRVANASVAARELSGLLCDLSVEENL